MGIRAGASGRTVGASLSFFDVKIEPGKEIPMVITVKEYFTPKDPALLFFAEADRRPIKRSRRIRPAAGAGRCSKPWKNACAR